jgi:hypothetical protein
LSKTQLLRVAFGATFGSGEETVAKIEHSHAKFGRSPSILVASTFTFNRHELLWNRERKA